MIMSLEHMMRQLVTVRRFRVLRARGHQLSNLCLIHNHLPVAFRFRSCKRTLLPPSMLQMYPQEKWTCLCKKLGGTWILF